MDKKRLDSISTIRAELASLSRQIDNWPQGIVSDYYKDYKTGRPKVKPLVGQADCGHLRQKRDDKLDELESILAELEEFLATIEDCTMAEILRLKYRNGMSCREIGQEVGYSYSVVAQKVRQFWSGK